MESAQSFENWLLNIHDHLAHRSISKEDLREEVQKTQCPYLIERLNDVIKSLGKRK